MVGGTGDVMVCRGQDLGDQPPYMATTRGVYGPPTVTAHCHQPRKPQFCQVLGHRRAGRPHLGGEAGHVVFASGQQPQQAQSSRISQHPKRGHRSIDLSTGWWL